MDPDTLDRRLRETDDGRALSDAERTALVDAMVAHLGSPDPELRDDRIYATLAPWIAEGVLSEKAVRDLLDTCLDDEHLFFDLGSRGEDSVFVRSFSLLYVAAALYRHTHTPFLSDAEVATTATRLFEYGRRERDLRGYVEGKGWAHAAAHLADALDELAQCEAVGAADLAAILAVVGETATTTETVYAHGEDDRMATAVLTVLDRDVLDEATVREWVASLADVPQTGDPSIDFRAVTNGKALLGSLHCRSADGDVPAAVRETIREARADLTGFD